MHLHNFVAWVNFTFYIIFLNWNNFFSSIRQFYLSYLNLTVLNLMLSITLAVYIKLFKKMTCCVFSVASVMSNSLQPVDCSLPVSSVCGIFPARIQDWVAMPSYGGSSRLWNQTCVSYIAGGFFTADPLRKPIKSDLFWQNSLLPISFTSM